MSTAARTAQNLWGSTVFRSTVVGFGVFGALLTTGLLVPSKAAAVDSSAVTVTAAQQDPDAANAPFPDLSVTVSQTTALTSQGIRLTYSGGTRSTTPNQQTAGANFLQVFQCWGDLKDASGNLVLDASGQAQPDRTTCQYGAGQALGLPGQSRTAVKSSLDDVSPHDDDYLYPGNGVFDPPLVSFPFRSITGKTLQLIAGGKIVSTDDIDSNEFFTKNTTNELDWAPFGAAGSGSATFEVQTNMQAPGLGCGNPITINGTTTGQPCWLVVIPRGDHDKGESAVIKSALLWENWQHRLAVPLQFKPLGVRCALGAAEKSLAGTELLAAAVASWQPELCGTSGGSTYNLIIANEADQLAVATGTATAPLALTTRPLGSTGSTGIGTSPGTDNLTYAPVAVTGLTFAFAVDHVSNPIDPAAVPDAVKVLDHQPITTLNLTPRLVAKLLTNSYITSLPLYANIPYLKGNPQNITTDPDFLSVNDAMWEYQNLTSTAALADALMPLGRSDSAVAVWNYVLSDPDAVAFLAGTADPWGMVVNPYSSTDAAKNPNGAGATYPTDRFPKADPVEVDIVKDPSGLSNVNLVTWRPFAADLDTAGYWVLRGDGRVLGAWDGFSIPHKYTAPSRDLAGTQKVLGVTDTASAAKYQIFTAALRNAAGEFVTPTAASMRAAAAVMTPTAGQAQVKSLDYTSAAVKSAAGAYPLTVPVYAATNAAGGDAASRKAYAAFIAYAATKGQTPGTDDGELPAGYAPLPASWVAAAQSAAAVIAAGPQPAATSTATSSTTTPAGAVTPESTNSSGDAYLAPVSSSVESGWVDTTPRAASPTATGDAAGTLTGAATPDDPSTGVLSSTVPISAAGGLAAAGCVPLVARRRRVI